jgi:hypothetical protein
MISRQQIEDAKNITQLKKLLKNELRAGISGMKSPQFKEAKAKAAKRTKSNSCKKSYGRAT